MFVTLKCILVALLAGEAFCQYIDHPFGGFSYITNSFHHGVGYSYVAPSGQTVNVKYATSALVQPPLTSASPQLSAPQFVFRGAETAPAPLALSTFQPNFDLSQNFAPSRPAGPPSPKSLFTPAQGGVPIQSDKQVQAYNDYLNQLEQENARTVTETQLRDFDPDVDSFV